MLRVALFLSIVGLVLLGFIAYFIATPHIELSELESFNGRYVVIIGSVESAEIYESVSFLELTDENNKVKVVAFEKISYSFERGDFVEVKGKISRYKGELEIIADEIMCLEC